MTTDLEQRLREALHEDAERARLVNPDGPPAPEARRLSDGQHPRRRRGGSSPWPRRSSCRRRRVSR